MTTIVINFTEILIDCEMVQSDSKPRLPNSEELPSCDDLPVDNELHILIPQLLSSILALIWAECWDWFFGINMGVYYATGVNPRVPIVPDAFLSLGVERIKSNRLRESYVVWEENEIAPIMTLEIVSKTPGGEYNEKMTKYARLGTLYYLIYNPEFWQRDRHEPFEVYRLSEGEYQRQLGEPFWMPEVGLGIGRAIGEHKGLQREWLYWYDQQGNRLNSPEDIVRVERHQKELAQQQAIELQAVLDRYRERFGELPEI